MSLGGRIDDGLDPMLAQNPLHQRLIADIPMHKSIPPISLEVLQVGEIAGILQRVHVDDLMAAYHDQATDQMRSDESGSSSHQDSHDDSSRILVYVGAEGQRDRGAKE